MIRARLVWLFIFIGALIFALWDTGLVALLAVALIPVVLLAAALINRFHRPRISATWHSVPAFARDETVAGTLRVTNGSGLFYRRMRATLVMHNELTGGDEALVLEAPGYARRDVDFDLQLKSRDCGNLICHCETLRLYDFFGLTYRTVSPGDCGSCTVLPHVFPVRIILRASGLAEPDEEIYSDQKPGQDMSEIFEFRDYVPGDRLSQVQWKLSQKHGHLIVKQGSFPLDSSVRLVADPGRTKARPAAYCAMAESAASISQSLCEARTRHLLSFPEADGFSSYVVENEADLAALLPRLMSAGRDKNRTASPDERDDIAHRVMITVDPEVAAASADRGDTVLFLGEEAGPAGTISLRPDEAAYVLAELTV